MKILTVLYDAECPLCNRSRCWLVKQPKRIRMRFLSQSSAAARAEYGPLLTDGCVKQLIAISDDGRVWRDERAWFVCLWALRDYRRL